MSPVYRLALPALIVLVGVGPVRAQERRTPAPDSITVLELRRVPRGGGEGRLLRRLTPDDRDSLRRFDRRARRPLRLRAPLAFDMPVLRLHLDSTLGDVHRFRLRLDSLVGDRSAFRLRLDSLVGHRLDLDTLFADGRRLRLHVETDSTLRHHFRTFGFDGPMPFFRDGERRPLRTLPRLRAPMRRFDDGAVEVERDPDGRVRVYRFRTRDGEAPGPGARVERRVLRLGPEGTVIEGDEDGVRVERDADGGLRIYVPAPRERPPARREAPRRGRG